MRESDLDLLESLVPGFRTRPLTSAYWLARSAEVIAASTQAREIYPVLDHSRGEGCWVYDLEGTRYLDMTSGVAVRALGWRYPPLVAFEQTLAHILEELPGQDFDHIPQTLLAERLIALTPGDFPKQVFFTTSGARAVESAVKAAIENTGRTRFVAFRPAFHGRTGYALALTAGKAVQRNLFPQALPVIRLPYPETARRPAGLSAEEWGWRCAEEVRLAIEQEGTDIAAIVVEPIAGEGGIIVPPDSFLRGLRAAADAYGAWLIVDEVQTGLGRTGRWWAIEHSGVVPDALCTAKALGVGRPFGAVIGRSPLFQRGGRHSETFAAEPPQALLTLFLLREIERLGLLENAARMGERLMAGLRRLAASSPWIGEVRGRGLMVGVEIVDPARPEVPAPALRDEVLRLCVRHGHLILLGAGTSAIRFLPPLNVTAEEIDETVARFERALAALAPDRVASPRG